MDLERQIKEKAVELGFDAAGIADAVPVDSAQAEHFQAWLDAGFAGRMEYMRRHVAKRLNPAELLPGARSVVVVALNYKPREGAADFVSTDRPRSAIGTVAQYACYEDYHDFIRPLLHELAAFVRERVGEAARFKVCVDSAPLAERALAVRAGLGFVGRNHMLIHPTLGPQVLLGAIVTTARFEADEPTAGTCGGCEKCLRACPTGALRADGRFDASRCISYLTMEHQGPIEPELAARIGNRLFGCDECVLACPQRDAAPICANTRLRYYPQRHRLDLAQVLAMTAEQFEAEFAGSPIHRLGLAGLQRNARLCLDNLSR